MKSSCEILLELCDDLEDEYPFLYVEISRTRVTGWMAHIGSHPNKEKSSFWVSGQGFGVNDACLDAIEELKKINMAG